MKYPVFISLFFLIAYSCSKDKQPDPVNYQMVWNDEFDYTGLPDKTKWAYDVGGNGWGNKEAQYYTDSRLENAEVKNGVLHIIALKEDFHGKNYTSARLVTKGKAAWTYGVIEVRAKLPEGTGMWPAIWMLPANNIYGGWPSSGEIDILENLGHIPYFIASTVQTEKYNYVDGTQKNSIVAVSDCYTQFHNYKLEWTPEDLKFYIDEKLNYTFVNDNHGYQVWPFDQSFYLILNVAVGGTFGGAKGIDDSIFPQSMEIDYVRISQK